MGEKQDDIILKVDHLTKTFQVKSPRLFEKPLALNAVNDVSFEVKRGETIGVIGESGCGKSTLGKAILQLIPATSGDVIYNGQSLMKLNQKEMNELRKEINMVFQDPYSSLNPRMTVGQIIGEGLMAHNIFKKGDPKMQDYIMEIMEKCGLASYFIHRYPHQFSGGQRQRIGIARSLAVHPKFVVCDEAVSALDVSIQAQVVNMFEELQEKLGVAYLFIAHDLLVVHHISDRIAVMYLGKMMEIADADELNANPIHPYTLSLLSAVPIPDPETARKSHRIVLEGDVPSPLKMPTGCPFRTRCKYATEKCGQEMPQLTDRGNGHMVACWNK